MPAPMECRCAPTATTRSRAATSAHALITPPRRAAPVRPNIARAGDVAARIVAAHGNTITVEDTNINTWARLWGKRIALFSPGMLVTALAAECAATGGALIASQHPIHRAFPALPVRSAGLQDTGPAHPSTARTAVCAATVTSFPPFWRPASTLADPEDPRTARVDYRLAHALRAWLASQQSGRVQSTGTSHHHHLMSGSARTGSHHPVASAEQAALGPPPNRPSQKPGRRGSSRKQPAPKLIRRCMTHYGSTLSRDRLGDRRTSRPAP